MRVAVAEQAGEPERRVAGLLVAEQGEGVAEDLAEQAAGEVPGVARPDPPDALALGPLAEGGVDAVARAAQERAASRLRIALGRAVRGDEAEPAAPRRPPQPIGGGALIGSRREAQAAATVRRQGERSRGKPDTAKFPGRRRGTVAGR